MKKIFTILFLLTFPIIAFGDLLPEPDILIDKEDGIEKLDETNPEDGNITMENKNINEENLDSNYNRNEDIEEVNDNFDPLQYIGFGFCNEGLDNITKSINAGVMQGEPFDICAVRENQSDRDIYIQPELVYTTISDIGEDVCGIDTGISKFLTSGETSGFILPAHNYVVKDYEITFPLGYEGEQKSCFTYHVADGESEEGGVGFNVVIRKFSFMTFFVGAIDGIKNELTINELNKKFNDNGDFIMSFWVENIGHMENKFDIQGTIKGFFGYNKKFESSDTIQLAPNKRHYIELNLGSLPSYGGKYNIDFTINGTPYFSYDISNANVDPARLEPKSWEFSTSVFKMPWLILAVVVIFILLLIVLFKKPKQKVVYVQQQPQQAVQPQQVQQQPTQQYTQSVQQPVQQPTQPVQQPQQPQNPNYPQN